MHSLKPVLNDLPRKVILHFVKTFIWSCLQTKADCILIRLRVQANTYSFHTGLKHTVSFKNVWAKRSIRFRYHNCTVDSSAKAVSLSENCHHVNFARSDDNGRMLLIRLPFECSISANAKRLLMKFGPEAHTRSSGGNLDFVHVESI
jgi:hypothetical protein